MRRAVSTMFLMVACMTLASTVHASESFPDKELSGYTCPPCGCSRCDSVYAEPGKCPGCGMDMIELSSLKNVAILIYDGVEILDFAGPYEVFAAEFRHYNVYTVAPDSGLITTGVGAMTVQPTYTLADCPTPDILIVPGGGTANLVGDKEVLEFVKKTAETAEIVMSVCTGAFVLGAAGLLDGLDITTHWRSIDRLREAYPTARVHDDRRFVDNGKIVTAAGVSSGIDASLHIIERQQGRESAQRVARYMQLKESDG